MAGRPDRLPFAGTFHRPAGFDAWRAALNAAVQYERFALVQELAPGGDVIQVVDASGTAVATGMRYGRLIVRSFAVRAGRIVRVRSSYDTAAYAAALGV